MGCHLDSLQEPSFPTYTLLVCFVRLRLWLTKWKRLLTKLLALDINFLRNSGKYSRKPTTYTDLRLSFWRLLFFLFGRVTLSNLQKLQRSLFNYRISRCRVNSALEHRFVSLSISMLNSNLLCQRPSRVDTANLTSNSLIESSIFPSDSNIRGYNDRSRGHRSSIDNTLNGLYSLKSDSIRTPKQRRLNHRIVI